MIWELVYTDMDGDIGLWFVTTDGELILIGFVVVIFVFVVNINGKVV